MQMARRLMAWFLVPVVGGVAVAAGDVNARVWEQLERCNVTWETPSKDSWGSMPLGNGDIGMNLWAESDGDVVFYLSKTDAWSENTRLLKLGRLRLRCEPNPFGAEKPFRQELCLRQGEIVIETGPEAESLRLRFWIDAHHPVVQVEAESARPVRLQWDFEPWRTTARELKPTEDLSAYGGPVPAIVEPDVVFAGREGEILWYHRNERSPYDIGIDRHPELKLPPLADPLLHRTFGCLVQGENLASVSPWRLMSAEPARQHRVAIYALTAQTDTRDGWVEQIEQLAAEVKGLELEQRRTAHRQWWEDFWLRSWIFVDGGEEAAAVSRGYQLQRFMNACSGRGPQPIKFNGSIFTVDLDPGEGPYAAQGTDADFRMWGGMYWWQNTRLIYWNMLMSGDFDLMGPLFEMYRQWLPLAAARTRLQFGHGGAYFLEVSHWYGLPIDMAPGTTPGYVTYYWQSGLEVAAMMMDYYRMTGDGAFLAETAVPLADAVVTFYSEHYPRDEQGKLRIEPAQALETYWEVVNPMPPLAGLDYVTEQLLRLPADAATAAQRAAWEKLRGELPPLPTRTVDGETLLAPAETILVNERKNFENPELYAIFPYRRLGLGRDGLALARRSYEQRIEKRTGGWFYDAIMAALVGLEDEAARIVHMNFTVPHAAAPGTPSPLPARFPGFLGPNYDWVPDQDQPSVAMIALQRMVLQQPNDKLLVLPAWPAAWNVFFKLHAYDRTVVQGDYRDGQLRQLDVTPAGRAAAVEVMVDEASARD